MRIQHTALAILITAIWGLNYVLVHLGLQQLSPQVLCFARFLGASVPAIFFIKRPAVPFRLIIYYSFAMFVLQFGLLFFGMQVGMTPSLASILMQLQVFFTVLLAFIFLGEQPSGWQLVGALVSFSGIVLIGIHLDAKITQLGFVLVIVAALSASVGNLISKKIGNVNMFGLVIWGSFIAWIPFLLLSLYVEGLDQILYSLKHLSGASAFSIFYTTFVSTMVGYVGWNWLLAKYPTVVVLPFMLLVPIFAFMSSALFLDEPLQSWKMSAAALVIAGLFINVLAPRLVMRINQLREANA